MNKIFSVMLSLAGAILRPLTRRRARAVPTRDLGRSLLARSAVVEELALLLKRARHKRPVALMIIDFMSAGIESGTHDGVSLVRRFGGALRSWVPEKYIVGHLRGREFAVFLPDLSVIDVEHIADRVVEYVRTDSSLQVRPGEIATTIGIGYSSKADCQPSELLSMADTALHYARSSGSSFHVIVDRDRATKGA